VLGDGETIVLPHILNTGDSFMARIRTTKPLKTKQPEPQMEIPFAVRSISPGAAAITGGNLDTFFPIEPLTGEPVVQAPEPTPERPVLELSTQQQALLVKTIMGCILAEMFTKNKEIHQKLLKPDLYALWVSLLFKTKKSPGNPDIKTTNLGTAGKQSPDCEGQFQVKAQFNLKASTAVSITAMLAKAGLPTDKAQKLVQENVTFVPNVTINFDELRNGKKSGGKFVPATPEQRAVADHAEKLLLSVPGTPPLTLAERKMLINQDPIVQVADGFLDRVMSYCETLEQLKGVLTVFVPTQAFVANQFGQSDSLMDRTNRLIDGVFEVLGVTPEQKIARAKLTLGIK
jgi:hypothetical protein